MHQLPVCRCEDENQVVEGDMTDYNIIIKQMEALAEEEQGLIPVMANASALLFHSMEDINWAGFYIVKAMR